MAEILEAAAVLKHASATSAAEFPLRQVIDDLPAAVYTTDAEGRIELFNRTAVALWGRSPERGDELWCGSWRLYYPDGRSMPHDECPMARALKTGKSIRGEEAIAERPDGSRVHFLAYPTPLRGASGRLVGAVNMLLDITDRKESESAIRRRESELTDFVENTTIGLHWVGPDGTILWANRAEMELLGYAPEEYIGRHIADFHADRHVIDDILGRLGCAETLRDYPARLRCKNGSIKHVLIDSSVYEENGEFIHTRCFTRDVTTQKQMERRLSIEATIAQLLSEAVSLNEAAPTVLKTLSEFFGAELVELWLGEDQLRFVDLHSSLAEKSLRPFRSQAEGIVFGPNEGLPGRVMVAKAPIWLADVARSPDFNRVQAVADLGLGAAVGIPILFGQRCLGVVTCFMRGAMSSESALVSVMMSIGHKLGLFIERTRGDDENRYLAAVVKASTDAIISTTVDGTINSWNEGAGRLLGYTAKEAIGQPISLVIPEEQTSERPRYVEMLKKGEIVDPFETVRKSKAGALVPVSVSIFGIHGVTGELIGTAAIVRDITERRTAEAQLSRRIQQLQAVSVLGMLAFASDDLQSLFDQSVSHLAIGLDVEFAKVLQIQPGESDLVLRAGVGWHDELIGKTAVGVDADSQAGYTLSVDQPVIVENFQSENRFKYTSDLQSNDIVSGLSVVIRREGHKPFGVLAVHSRASRRFTSHDVHFIQSVANILATALQRKSFEDRQEMLIRELSHRVKNTLAVIQAIARQTGVQADGIKDFVGRFEGRLFALAQAHDLLTASNWGGASLIKLVGLLLGTHLERKRLELDIEDIKLSPTGTQAMVMVFHELMTNAAKYGAHSVEKGKVIIEGRHKKKGSESIYALAWREVGGPTVTKPKHRGFGSELVTSTIQMQCQGKLVVDWRPEGLVVDCAFPLSAIADVQDASRRPWP